MGRSCSSTGLLLWDYRFHLSSLYRPHLSQHLTVTRCTEIGLRHIEAEQTVEVIGHGLREFDEFLVAFLVRYGNLVLHWDGEVLTGFILVLIVFFIDFVYFNFLFALDVDVGVVYLSLKVEPTILNNRSSSNPLDSSSLGLQCSLNF